MSSQQITGIAVAAVLVFWLVGAYNRLVTLRSAISRSFQVLDAELQHRQAALLRWLDGLRPLVEPSAPGLEALQAVGAADGQVQAALGALRRRPTMPREATTLRLAEDTLGAARQRLQTEAAGCAAAAALVPPLVPASEDAPLLQMPADGFADTLPVASLVEAAEPSALPAAAPAAAATAPIAADSETLAQADITLGFARRQFNEATERYNAARRQFPTWLVAGLFGFRSAGTL